MERAGIRNKGMADVTNRRENDVKQRMEKLLDREHLKTHIGIDYQYMKISKARFAIDNSGYPAETIR